MSEEKLKTVNMLKAEKYCLKAFDWIVEHDRFPNIRDKNENKIYNMLNYIKGREKRDPDSSWFKVCLRVQKKYSHFLVVNVFEDWPKTKKTYNKRNKIKEELKDDFRNRILERFKGIIEWVDKHGKAPKEDGGQDEKKLLLRMVPIKSLGLQEECKKMTDNPLVLEMLK